MPADVAQPLHVDLTAEINLAHNAKASPLSFAPDIWWTEARWTIGFTHSMASVDRFQPGGSLCVRTDDLYCDSVYHGSHVDARYQLAPWVSPRVRVLVRDIEPFKPAITVGALVERAYDRITLRADPYLQLGLANRAQGNRAAIVLPLELALAVGDRVSASLYTGWDSDLAVITDGWHVPIGAGGHVRVDDHFTVGAAVGFASLLGPQNTPKERVLFLSVGWQ